MVFVSCFLVGLLSLVFPEHGLAVPEWDLGNSCTWSGYRTDSTTPLPTELHSPNLGPNPGH